MPSRKILIPTPDGNQVPLGAVADIDIRERQPS